MSEFRLKAKTKGPRNYYSFYIGLFFIIIFLFLYFLSYVYDKDPTLFDMGNRFASPSQENLLGTDQFGRDVLARIMFSMRSVFSVGVASVLFGAIIGTLIGILAGISNKYFQRILMSFIDGLIAFPGILLAMLVVFIMGRGARNTIVAIGIMMIPIYARLSYSTILEVKPKLYIKAARSYGLNKFNIVINHIFPTLLPKLITQLTSSIAGAITIESSLSFLGLGIQPPNASLGLMLNEAQQFVLLHPFLIIPPGISLMIVVLGFIFVGDAMNDYLIDKRGD